jgi:toxin YoeB
MSLEDYKALEETAYLLRSPKNARRLLESIAQLEGIGKPEPLKHGLAGYGSRRINDEQRLVYKAQDDSLLIAQCRYQY